MGRAFLRVTGRFSAATAVAGSTSGEKLPRFSQFSGSTRLNAAEKRAMESPLPGKSAVRVGSSAVVTPASSLAVFPRV